MRSASHFQSASVTLPSPNSRRPRPSRGGTSRSSFSPRDDADHGEFFRQQPSASKIVERRNEQALGQVPGGTENHQDAGVSRAAAWAAISAGPPWARRWPPNLLRMADSSLSAKLSFSRERKRA